MRFSRLFSGNPAWRRGRPPGRGERFGFITSDKAVNPTGVMGAIKRVVERLVLHTARHQGLKCAAVRFGNVSA